MDPDSKRLRVSVSDGTGRAVRDGGLARWLAAVAPPRAAGEVNVALVSDLRMRALNRKYRRKDTSTDVLHFADVFWRTLSAFLSARGAPPPLALARRLRAALGPRALWLPSPATSSSRQVWRARREAGHSYQTELRVLALHGLLHLLGYDHHDRRDNGRMGRVEAALRRKGGLASGLIERASAPRALAKSRRVGA